MRPSNCSMARSITCSSSAPLSAPAPATASRCPHASEANRARSRGPTTRIVMTAHASALRKDHVADLLQLPRQVRLQLTESMLAMLREYFADRHALASRYLVIEVEKAAPQAFGEQTAHGRLAAPRKADKHNVRQGGISRRVGLRGAKGSHRDSSALHPVNRHRTSSGPRGRRPTRPY